MARFDAATALEQLEYVFLDHPEYDGTKPGKGVIPEFTDGQLRAFGEELNAIFNKVEPTGKDGKAVPRRMTELLSADRLNGVTDELTESMAKFCRESPSRAELAGLPFRVRQKFFEWLLKELFNPKDSTPALPKPRGA